MVPNLQLLSQRRVLVLVNSGRYHIITQFAVPLVYQVYILPSIRLQSLSLCNLETTQNDAEASKVQGSVGLTPILQSQWWRRSPVARNSWFLRRWSRRFWMSSVLPTRPTSDGPASAVMCWSQVGRFHQVWLVHDFGIFWP